MSFIYYGIWNNNIKAWKILWLGLAYYIVFSFLSFFLFSLFFNNLYTAQFSGHLNIYTYFISDSEKNLFSDPAVIDFAKGISEGFGNFYKSVAEYSLTSNNNTSTVSFLGFYNFLLFIFWVWWCISLWRNSKNTNNMFFSGFLKFVSINAVIYPIYYFILSFMFFNAATYGAPVIEEVKEIKTSEIGGKLNIDYYDIQFSITDDWIFNKKTNQTLVLKKCLNNNEKQCGFMTVKKLEHNDFALNINKIEEWIKYLNPTHDILSKNTLSFKNKEIIYFNYNNIYRSVESEVKMIAFKTKKSNYIIEWIAPIENKNQFFKTFNQTFSSMKISE